MKANSASAGGWDGAHIIIEELHCPSFFVMATNCIEGCRRWIIKGCVRWAMVYVLLYGHLKIIDA